MFLDTLSEVNVLNARRAFPSDRCVQASDGQFAFHDMPFWDLGFMEMMETRKEFEWDVDMTMRSRVMTLFGRPMWASFIKAGSVTAGSRAKLKLTGKVKANDKEPMSDQAKIAIFGNRVCFAINPYHRLAGDLISSYQGYLVRYEKGAEWWW